MSKIKGDYLMIYVGCSVSNYSSIAYATNSTLEISADEADTTNKDEANGGWKNSEINQLSWSAQSENLFSFKTDGKGFSYEDLMDKMIDKAPLTMTFGYNGASGVVPADGWTPNISTTHPAYTGLCHITSLSLTAQTNEYSTYSVTLTGAGPLTKVTTA